jgi:hypothetical protein
MRKCRPRPSLIIIGCIWCRFMIFIGGIADVLVSGRLFRFIC